jgi:NADH-quinone oxidoreductase subunit C
MSDENEQTPQESTEGVAGGPPGDGGARNVTAGDVERIEPTGDDASESAPARADTPGDEDAPETDTTADDEAPQKHTTAAHEAGVGPEYLPAAPGPDTTPVPMGERTGMFGARGGQDTSGYGGLKAPILFPGAAERPYGRYFDEVADHVEQALEEAGTAYAAAVHRVVVDRGELTLHVRREHLPAVARALRDDPALRFEMCTGVSGVHYPEDRGAELHAVYHLLSITHGGRRVRVEVTCPDGDPHIPSIVETYPANDWHERETWDMFGIVFDGHPALTRILMPDDWPGHPQRKDYPLGGVPVEYKGATVPPPDQRRSYT